MEYRNHRHMAADSREAAERERMNGGLWWRKRRHTLCRSPLDVGSATYLGRHLLVGGSRATRPSSRAKGTGWTSENASISPRRVTEEEGTVVWSGLKARNRVYPNRNQTGGKVVMAERSMKYGAPSRIRTCGLCLRRAALYPAELWVLTVSQCCGNAYVNFSRVERSERGPRKSRSDNPFLLLFVPRPLRICHPRAVLWPKSWFTDAPIHKPSGPRNASEYGFPDLCDRAVMHQDTRNKGIC